MDCVKKMYNDNRLPQIPGSRFLVAPDTNPTAAVQTDTQYWNHTKSDKIDRHWRGVSIGVGW